MVVPYRWVSSVYIEATAISSRLRRVAQVIPIQVPALSDLNGKVPEQKQMISIDDGEAAGHPFFQKYRIVTSDVEMGMIILELEAYDE